MAGAPVGNRNASKQKPWEDALRRAVLQDDGKRLRQAAEMLLDAAAGGDLQAIKELGDRLDGRPKQAVEHSGAEGGPVVHALRPQLTREEWLAAHGIHLPAAPGGMMGGGVQDTARC